MRATGTIFLVAALLLAQLALAPLAFAATDNASSVESYTPGTQKGGDPIAPDRDDPSEALGAPDGDFVSLGYGGELILGFPVSMSGNLSVTVFETTNQPYPLEQAEVAVSNSSTGPWTIIGTADNEGDAESTFDVAQCFQYVRLIDTTDADLHSTTSDAFDVDAASATYDEECAEEEPEEPEGNGDEGDVSIKSSNHAFVLNDTSAEANTGGNFAGGSQGGNGGSGGDIDSEGGSQDIENAITGSGGAGGDGGAGGLITTGDATAGAATSNRVNTTNIEVDRCACEGDDRGDVRIHTRSSAFLGNSTYAGARTGHNFAMGSEGGTGGDGGNIGSSDESGEGEGQELDDITTGSGGAGGLGSIGGEVMTGAANSHSSTENVVNRTRVRVSR